MWLSRDFSPTLRADSRPLRILSQNCPSETEGDAGDRVVSCKMNDRQRHAVGLTSFSEPLMMKARTSGVDMKSFNVRCIYWTVDFPDNLLLLLVTVPLVNGLYKMQVKNKQLLRVG
jgi:hypothetical protein